MARGSVFPYELAGGKRRYMAMYRTSNGVQRKKKGFSSRRDAQSYLNAKLAAVERGEVIATTHTFASYFDAWLTERRPHLEEGTYVDYRTHGERRLKPYFGAKRLTDITPADIRRYVAALLEGTAEGGTRRQTQIIGARRAAAVAREFTVADMAEQLGGDVHSTRRLVHKLVKEGSAERTDEERASTRPGRRHVLYRYTGVEAEDTAALFISPKTVNNSLGVLRVALGHAVEDGLLGRNPAASTPGARQRIKLPTPHREMDYLRLDEIPRYLAGCSKTYRPLAELLVACGLRISEALALNFADVDFRASTLLVLRSGKRGRDGTPTVGSTKGDWFRSVEFGPRLAEILRDLRAAREELTGSDVRSLPVFVGAHGARLNRNDVSRDDHKAALHEAGLRTTLRLHDLRHTAAASWLAAGLPLIYVQRQLGHRSITTTERQYGHLEKGFMIGAAKRGEAVIWEGRIEVPEVAYSPIS